MNGAGGPRRPRAPGPRRPERPAPAARARAGLSRPASRGTVLREVARVQVRGLLRDRRALFAAFVLPILLYPLLFLGNSWLQRLSTETLDARTVKVALDLRAAPPAEADALAARVAAAAPIEVETVDAAPLRAGWDWAVGAADNGAARERAAVLLETGYDALLVALPADLPGQWSAVVWFDGTRDLSNEARSRVHDAALLVHDELVSARRLALLGFDPARGLELAPIDVASAQDQSGAQLGRWLPLLAVFVLLAGASHAALSAFAGEREAGTLETLLVQPVESASVVGAKFAVVLGVGVLTLLLNAGSVIASLALGLGALPGAGGEHPLALDAGRMLLAAALFLPAAVLLCALLCLSCGRARTFREGQQILLPLLLVCVVPVLPALQPEVELDLLLATVPLCGPALVVRDALRGAVAWPLAAWMFAASSAWAGLALFRLSRALDAERLVQNAGSEDESASRRVQSRTALRWALVVVFAVYLVGGWWQSLHGVWGLAATLWVLLPLATWLSARGTARRARETLARTLQLGLPNPAHALGALLLAPAVALGSRLLFEWQRDALPMPRGFAEAALPPEIASLAPWAQVALLALSPAICEELFFRGALLGGLRRDLATPRVLAWQALLFGVVHASIYRFVPSALLGALLATLALRARSLWPAVLLHAAYNAILILQERVAWLADPRLAWVGVFALPLFLLAPPNRGNAASTA